METEAESVKDQLRSSGAAFSVKYIGFIEVATPFHDVKVSGEKRIALCNGCASLIAQAADLIPKKSIDPEIEELIGANEPKFFNKEIELTITNKVMTLFSTDDRKLLKKVEIANISIAVTVGDTLKNGFVFIGKAKTKTNELKRFCFLLKSQEDPKNIYFAINVAFSMCDQASNNNKNGTAAAINNTSTTTHQTNGVEEKAIFKKPYLPPPRENDVLSYLNVGDKSGGITTLLRQKIGKPRPHLDPDIKSYPGPFPDYTPNAAKVYKTSDGERVSRKPEDKNGISRDNFTLGDLIRKSPSINGSIYTNVFGDDLASSLLAPIETCSNTTCTSDRFEQICDGIEKLPYFFGRITRYAAENYLKYDGSYLIRISDSRALTVILSVRQDKIVHHILLNDKNGNVTSDSNYFVSIHHLMAFHTRRNLPFTTEGSNNIKVYIKHPTPRPQKQI
uniref:SH2 domain-containing protein n=1 Tax=Panagrolaimus sp. ES5 TaxID=591445 RepID=A0AC34GVF5_9BILA